MYGIKIYAKNYNQKVNMEEITNKLTELDLLIEADSDHNTVFVSPMEVDKSVKVLNEMGYVTDEDENDEE